MTPLRTDLVIAWTVAAILLALALSGCVKGDVNIYYGGHKVAQVSNLAHAAHSIASDISEAKAATPGWWTALWEAFCEYIGIPKAAGGLAAVLTTFLLGKIGWRKLTGKKEKKPC